MPPRRFGMNTREKIEYLRDDIQCMLAILRSETDIATRGECYMRIDANRREIKRLEDLS